MGELIKAKIMAVDDESVNRLILEEILVEDFELKTVDSGEESLELLKVWTPDIVLMDVKMPGISGLEACQKIREDYGDSGPYVIFLSALSLPEERMAGYDAGGDDYMTKPFQEDELKRKIKLALEYRKNLIEKQQSSETAFNTAMTAMNSASELGAIMQFFKDSFTINAVEDLANRIIESIAGFGCKAIVCFHFEEQPQCYSYAGVVKQLEIELLEQLHNSQRIYSFGKRSSFHYGKVSILVLDMPVEDDEKYGRFKDHFAMIAEGADARVDSLDAQRVRDILQSKSRETVDVASRALSNVMEQQQQNHAQYTNIRQMLFDNIEKQFFGLGLTEEQEKSILSAIEAADNEADKLFEQSNMLESELKKVTNILTRIH